MLWLVLMLVMIGGIIYIADKKIKAKFDDKFNPTDWDMPRTGDVTGDVKPPPLTVPVKLSYTKKPSVFIDDSRRYIFTALQQAVENEYIVLPNINVSAVLSIAIAANNNALAVQVATKNLTAKQFDFVLCNKTQLTPMCAIMLGDSLDHLLVSACEDAQLPLARFKIQTSYDVAVIRASLLRALGHTEMFSAPTDESFLDIVDAPVKPNAEPKQAERKQAEHNQAEQKIDRAVTPNSDQKALADSGIDVELCPECSAVMLKRKAKNGAAAGKLFWICSTYPKCRGFLPLNSGKKNPESA